MTCAHVTRQADVDPMYSARVDQTISTLVDLTGANERIFKSPIPLVYTRLTGKLRRYSTRLRDTHSTPAQYLPSPQGHMGPEPLALYE